MEATSSRTASSLFTTRMRSDLGVLGISVPRASVLISFFQPQDWFAACLILAPYRFLPYTPGMVDDGKENRLQALYKWKWGRFVHIKQTLVGRNCKPRT